MTRDHDRSHDARRPDSLLKSRAGGALIVFLAIAGVLLAYEHRVHLLTGNALLLVLLALCVGVHLFMHGGHGGHGGSRDGGRQ